MKAHPEEPSATPRKIVMEKCHLWDWRILVIGDGRTTEHRFLGPRWLASRHIRRLYHRLSHD